MLTGLPLLGVSSAAILLIVIACSRFKWLIVILGTLISTVLEKSGATLRIAESIINLFGRERPVLAITVIGAVVCIMVSLVVVMVTGFFLL